MSENEKRVRERERERDTHTHMRTHKRCLERLGLPKTTVSKLHEKEACNLRLIKE